MRIALISFEFPPAVAVGGIGTYAWNAAGMLADKGMSIEVFAAGDRAETIEVQPGLTVHRISANQREIFSRDLVPVLVSAHERSPFDVIEAPEIGPEGPPAFAALPDVARVVKLHTPTFLVNRVGWNTPSFKSQLRFWAGSLIRGRWRTLQRPRYNRAHDQEYLGALLADEIAAPSRAIAEILTDEWSLPDDKVHVYPYPFTPSRTLLDLALPNNLNTIGFLGRLEPRKGIIEMTGALKNVLGKHSDLQVRFIGPSWPFGQEDSRQWIEKQLAPYTDQLVFTGAVPHDRIASELTKCDAIVLPSRWENFPFACWESMVAGRLVIGSQAGGMAEVIENGLSGMLIEPKSPESIAAAILKLLQQPESLTTIASMGRKRVLTKLAPACVLPLQTASYERAIEQAKVRNGGSY